MQANKDTKINLSGVAQGKRVGPITQRSEDRNLLSLNAVTKNEVTKNAVTNYYCKQYKNIHLFPTGKVEPIKIQK